MNSKINQILLENNNSIKELQQLYSMTLEVSKGKMPICGHNVKKLKETQIGYIINPCVFCLDGMIKNKPITKYDCGHIFDRYCADEYIKETYNCAICRAETKYVVNYENIADYFNFECLECEDDKCHEHKLHQQFDKIEIDDYNKDQITTKIVINIRNVNLLESDTDVNLLESDTDIVLHETES